MTLIHQFSQNGMEIILTTMAVTTIHQFIEMIQAIHREIDKGVFC
jgi:hypothetical protein